MEKSKYERKFVVSEPSHKLYKSGIVEFIFGEDMKLNFVNFIFDGQKFTAPMNSRDYAKKIGAWILTNAQTGAPINYEEKVRLYFFCKDAVKKYKEDVSISFIRILEDFPSQIELIEKYLEDEKGLNAFEKKQRIEKVCHKNRDINSLNSYFRSVINSKKQKRVFLERAVEDEKSKLEILREKKGLGKPTKLADFLTTSFEITKSNFENIKYGVLKTEFKENNKNIKRISFNINGKEFLVPTLLDLKKNVNWIFQQKNPLVKVSEEELKQIRNLCLDVALTYDLPKEYESLILYCAKQADVYSSILHSDLTREQKNSEYKKMNTNTNAIKRFDEARNAYINTVASINELQKLANEKRVQERIVQARRLMEEQKNNASKENLCSIQDKDDGMGM